MHNAGSKRVALLVFAVASLKATPPHTTFVDISTQLKTQMGVSSLSSSFFLLLLFFALIFLSSFRAKNFKRNEELERWLRACFFPFQRTVLFPGILFSHLKTFCQPSYSRFQCPLLSIGAPTSTHPRASSSPLPSPLLLSPALFYLSHSLSLYLYFSWSPPLLFSSPSLSLSQQIELKMNLRRVPRVVFTCQN